MTNTPAIASSRTSRFTQRLRTEGNSKIIALLIGLLVVALAIRVVALNYKTIDYNFDLNHWVEYLRKHGFAGFKDYFYNYNPPYLYFLYLAQLLPIPNIAVVKLVSLFFDVVLAGGVAAIFYHFRRNLYGAFLVAAVVLILPEEFLNSAVWGQVDAGYTSLLVWAAFFFIRNKQVWGWVFFATAFAFKAQALFLLPAILIIFILKRQHVISLLVALLTFLAWDLPCIIAGRSASSLAGIYFDQVGTYHTLSANAPNFYFLIDNNYYSMLRTPLLLVGAVLTMVVFVGLFLRRDKASETSEGLFILRIMLVFAIFVPFVLPQMHERYFYDAGVFAFILALVDRRYVIPAILVQIANVLAYIPFLFGSIPNQVPYLPGTGYLVDLGVVPEFLAVAACLYLGFVSVTQVRGMFQREAVKPRD